jgi:BrnA antitoxin of type II toxin-antitoxin system
MEAPKTGLQPEFEGSAAPPPERVTVTLDIDADVLEWLKAQPLDWQREINNAARFIMDMSSQPVPPIEVYEDAARWEIAGPDPARNADRIDNEFTPA